jgi:hypothetical protein
MPCLNEAHTLQTCIAKVLKVEITYAHREEAVSIDKLLSARQGTIRIIASRTWLLKDFQHKTNETRALAVWMDYEPVSVNGEEKQ